MNSNMNVLDDAINLLTQHGFEIKCASTILPGIDLGLEKNQAIATIKITDKRGTHKQENQSKIQEETDHCLLGFSNEDINRLRIRYKIIV